MNGNEIAAIIGDAAFHIAAAHRRAGIPARHVGQRTRGGQVCPPYGEDFNRALLTRLKLTNLKLGLFANFGQALIKSGITRAVTTCGSADLT